MLILVGVPLANFDGTGMWGVFPSTPELFAVGSTAQEVGEAITTYLGVAHGWLYMIFLVTAFLLSRRAGWDLPFTVVTLVCGTDPAAVVLGRAPRHRAGARRAPRAGLTARDAVTTAFVLGGGGVLGAVEVGMLRALLRARHHPRPGARHQRRRAQRRAGRPRARRWRWSTG